MTASGGALGRKRWAIAEGYIPGWSNGPAHLFTSHETACLLNTSDDDAHVQITIFYSDREPVGPYEIIVSRTANQACAVQRSPHARGDIVRHRLRERHRLRCADRRAIHPPRFPAGRERLDHDDGISRRLKSPWPIVRADRAASAQQSDPYVVMSEEMQIR